MWGEDEPDEDTNDGEDFWNPVRAAREMSKRKK